MEYPPIEIPKIRRAKDRFDAIIVLDFMNRKATIITGKIERKIVCNAKVTILKIFPKILLKKYARL